MTTRGENQGATSEQGRSESQGQTQSQSQGLSRRADQGGMVRYGGLVSPFDLIRRFTEDVDRLFLAAIGGPGAVAPYETAGRAPARMSAGTSMPMVTWVPSVEVTTRGDDLVIATDLPGVKPEDVQVEVEGNNLIIRGESRAERENKDEGYWYSERSYGAFYRSIPLPPGVSANNVRAEFKNGALEVTLPGAAKSLQPQRQRIAIQGAPQATQQAPGTQTAQGTTGSQGTAQPVPAGSPQPTAHS